MIKIEIGNNDTIHDLNIKFMKVFPYLKLNFFTKGHQIYSGSHSKFQFHNENVKMSELTNVQLPKWMEFNASLSTFEFEKWMENIFGLHVQVMRKSDDLYLITSKTDDWTLTQQNEEGFLSQKLNEIPEEEKLDYRDMD